MECNLFHTNQLYILKSNINHISSQINNLYRFNNHNIHKFLIRFFLFHANFCYIIVLFSCFVWCWMCLISVFDSFMQFFMVFCFFLFWFKFLNFFKSFIFHFKMQNVRWYKANQYINMILYHFTSSICFYIFFVALLSTINILYVVFCYNFFFSVWYVP